MSFFSLSLSEGYNPCDGVDCGVSGECVIPDLPSARSKDYPTLKYEPYCLCPTQGCDFGKRDIS